MTILAKAEAKPKTGGRTWYGIKTKAEDSGDKTIEVLIYDEIGLWGVSAANFVRDLKALDDGSSAVVVSINSPGGDVFDGFAIHNALVHLGDRCTVRIEGLAASAASIIACGGHQVIIAENAMMMIHNPWTFAYGTAEDLRKTADMMDKSREGILASYRRKAPSIEDADLIKMLDDETWLTAEETVALGFADMVGETVSMKACYGSTGVLARFKHPPKAILEASEKHANSDTDSEAQYPEIENSESAEEEAESEAGEEKSETTDLTEVVARSSVILMDACVAAGIAKIAGVLIMKTDLNDETAVKVEADRIRSIGELCALARLPELAVDYVKSGLSAEAVRARLLDKIVEASEDKEINNKEPVGDGGDKTKVKAKTPSAKNIYAARKKKPANK